MDLVSGAGRFYMADEGWTGDFAASIKRACLAVDEPQTRELIVEMHGLLSRAPEPIAALIGTLPEVSRLEQMLSLGATESAARRLLSSAPIGFMLSRGPSSDFMASAWMPEFTDEIRFDAASEAIAFTGALARALYELVSHTPAPCAPKIRLVE